MSAASQAGVRQVVSLDDMDLSHDEQLGSLIVSGTQESTARKRHFGVPSLLAIGASFGVLGAAIFNSATSGTSLPTASPVEAAEHEELRDEVVQLSAGAMVLAGLPSKSFDVCKEPHACHIPQSSGPQCQHSMWKDRPRHDIVAVNLLLLPKDLAFLNNDPTRGEYVPCSIVVDYNQPGDQLFIGATCKYSGSTGSFMGCTDAEGRAKVNTEACRQLSWNVKLKDAKTPSGDKAKKILGTKKLKLKGMQHDDSLARNHIGYSILRNLDIVAPCSVAANVFLNGCYQGVSDLTEVIDSYFTENRFADDYYKGEATLWKETWFDSCNPLWYKNVKPIPDFADREIIEEGDGGPGYDLFAAFTREAKACYHSGKLCTKFRARAIVEKYTHPESWIDGLVGISLSANSDQMILLKHNFYFYITNWADRKGRPTPNKFYFLPWDYDQVLYDITGSPIPGYAVALPWYEIVEGEQRKQVCPYNVPSSDSDLTQRRFAHFTCEPVGYIMGLAWKDAFLHKMRQVDMKHQVTKVLEDVTLWSTRIASSLTCGAANGGWPTSAPEQWHGAKALTPNFEQVVRFWKHVAWHTLPAWPSPTFADFPREVTTCMFDGILAAQYLGQAGIAITDASKDCVVGENGVQSCATDISNVIASFGFVSTFISSLFSSCPFRTVSGFAMRGNGPWDHRAECSEQVSRLVASLANIAASSAGVSEMCVPGVAQANRGLPPPVPKRLRRLDEVHFDENRATQKATCTFDSIGATFWLARAAITIDKAAESCGHRYGLPELCSRDVFGVIESFGYVGQYLADAVAQCAEEAHFPLDQAFEATCGSDISQFVGAMAGVGEAGSGMAFSSGDKIVDRRGKDEAKDKRKRHLTPASYLTDLDAAKAAFEHSAKGDHSQLKQWLAQQGAGGEVEASLTLG